MELEQLVLAAVDLHALLVAHSAEGERAVEVHLREGWPASGSAAVGRHRRCAVTGRGPSRASGARREAEGVRQAESLHMAKASKVEHSHEHNPASYSRQASARLPARARAISDKAPCCSSGLLVLSFLTTAFCAARLHGPVPGVHDCARASDVVELDLPVVRPAERV